MITASRGTNRRGWTAEGACPYVIDFGYTATFI